MKRILLSARGLFSIRARAAVISTVNDGLIGLYPAANFATLQGGEQCKDCQTTPQALWYFRHELIAVPPANVSVAGFSTRLSAQQSLVNQDIVNCR